MSGLVLKSINKIYHGGHRAIRELNLEIGENEFLVLSGPDGCGKSTLLRIIAGLEEADSGMVFMDGENVTEADTKDRGVAMLFGNSVLYPEMSVHDNLVFALRMSKLSQPEIAARVRETAELLELEPLLEKMPDMLSGPETFCALLGRAVIRRPSVFLLDITVSGKEPELLSCMGRKLGRLHERMGITMICAVGGCEALKLPAGRLIVMNDGAICQDGMPKDVYEKPSSRFVAEFIGCPSMNIVPAVVFGEDNCVGLSFEGGRLMLPDEKGRKIAKGGYFGKEVLMGIRPKGVHAAGEATSKEALGGVAAGLEGVENRDGECLLHFHVGEADCTASADRVQQSEVGKTLVFQIDAAEVHVFDKTTEKTITN